MTAAEREEEEELKTFKRRGEPHLKSIKHKQVNKMEGWGGQNSKEEKRMEVRVRQINVFAFNPFRPDGTCFY